MELDEKGEPLDGHHLSSIVEEVVEDEEFKTTAYANNAFAFNEEKLQSDSVAASSSVDVRSTDIEETELESSTCSLMMGPVSRQQSTSSLSLQSRHSALVDVSLLEGPYEQLVKRQAFQRDLLGNVSAIKQCVTGLKEDIKSLKMKKATTAANNNNQKSQNIRQRFHQN